MPKSRQEQIQNVLFDFYRNPVARVSMELVFSIVAVIFFAIFAIRPTLQTMSELVKEIKDKQILDEQLDQKIASLNTAQSQYQKFNSQFYLLDEAIPKTARLVEGLKIVEKIASENDLVIQGITISAVPDELSVATADKAKRDSLTFNVDVVGDYLKIRQFINDLMNSRRMMIIDQVNFSLGSSRYQENLTALVRINLPYYRNETAADTIAPAEAVSKTTTVDETILDEQ
ncbi:MAG TPA: type 4a pilus biogenesis protein PilO [Candidatus Woesebacteria bacterium]|nr:type 4a pilus biogenesis protein PilO [Candidatus Woesebacteria bacterium]